MSRLFKFRHSYLDYVIDLGNIKSIEIGVLSSFVRIKLFRNFEYVINPKNNDLELLEPEIGLDFSTNEKAQVFAETLSKAWKIYLDIKGEC